MPGSQRKKRKEKTVRTVDTEKRTPFLSLSQDKVWDWIAPILLFCFGIYLSILYFGHQVVPNSDFPAFVDTADAILHFKFPATFKRLPGLGILQIALSVFVGGPHPVLTAGILLNSILLSCCGLLIYLITKRFLGKAAFWTALIAMVNPWVLQWSLHPIAELPLIFFILLTFYLLFEHGRWAYLAAFYASLIRYEGAVLIPIVFLWDICRNKTWKQRSLAVLFTFLAGLPVALWVLGVVQKGGGSTGYLGAYQAVAKGAETVYIEFASNLWRNSTGFLETSLQTTTPYAQTPKYLYRISQFACLLAVTAAVGWGIRQKQWDVLSVVGFGIVYYILHATRSGTRARYGVPLIWPAVIVCVYGFMGIGQLLSLLRKKLYGSQKLPTAIFLILSVVIFIISLVWIFHLTEPMKKFAIMSPTSASVPWVAGCIGVMYGILMIVKSRGRMIGPVLAALGIMGVFLTCNQFYLVKNTGTGKQDYEFKQLADWYIENARPDERLMTTMPHVVKLFAPKHGNNFLNTGGVRADSTEQFIQECYRLKASYVVWDSRLGLIPSNSYYRKWKLHRIGHLGPRRGPKNQMVLPPKQETLPFELIKVIQNEYYPNRFLFIYKVHSPQAMPSQ